MGWKKTNAETITVTDAETNALIRREKHVREDEREKLPIRTPFMLVTQRDTPGEKWWRLSSGSVKLLLMLGWMMSSDGTNHVDLTVREIYERLQGCKSLSQNSIAKGMRELKEVGFITRHHRRGYVLNESEIYKKAYVQKKK